MKKITELFGPMFNLIKNGKILNINDKLELKECLNFLDKYSDLIYQKTSNDLVEEINI